LWESDKICILEMPSYWDVKVFKKFLGYLYHGGIMIRDVDESRLLSEMAYEFLIDSLMIYCNKIEKFPSYLIESEENVYKRFRKLVGIQFASDILFVMQKKKLYAHKVVLALFCENFMNLLKGDTGLNYIEVKSVNDTESIQTFKNFLKILYCNFSVFNESKQLLNDITGLLRLAEEFKVDQLKEMLSIDKCFITLENFGDLYNASISLNLETLKLNCIEYVKTRCEFIHVKKALSWPKSSVKVITNMINHKEIKFNWLDILWFSSNIKSKKLKKKSVEKLKSLINTENAIQVLSGAQGTEENELRSIVLDFIISNTEGIELFHRNKPYDDIIAKDLLINESLTNEFVDKVMDKFQMEKKKIENKTMRNLW